MHREHRERFFEAMGDGVAFLPAPGQLQRNNDTEYNYRPESSFWWLTGLNEPDAVAVFVRKGKSRRFLLFLQPKDPTMEMWNGRRLGPKGAKSVLGADEAHSIGEFGARIDELLKGHRRVLLPLRQGSACEREVVLAVDRLHARRRQPGVLPSKFIDVRRVIHALRLVKSPAELAKMERAAAITGRAFREVFSLVKPGLMEYQLRAVFPAVYGLHGGDWSFETIAAAGANACTLHYTSCRDRLRDGELVLFDAGAEFEHYAADVTRTIPVNGRFSKPQETVYRAVLAALEAAVEMAKPGVTVEQVHMAAVETIVDRLLAIGALKGARKTLLKKEAWKRWFPHGTSHWLGLDVHDVGSYAGDEAATLLKPGMVITVEPGLYFPVDDKKAPAAFRGIGVRIEDDVLITEDGCRVLTADIPREPREVEAAMARRPTVFRALEAPTGPPKSPAKTTGKVPAKARATKATAAKRVTKKEAAKTPATATTRARAKAAKRS